MSIHSTGQLLERIGRRLRRHKQPKQIWFDVGAHLGEKTIYRAMANPNLTVYAFEPNLKLAAQRMGYLVNFIMLPFAIAETDGATEFYLNSYDSASSLLPFNREALSQWNGAQKLNVERVITVPTIRLDTFMNEAGIRSVDFLKIDAQGSDLSVLKSAGDRLRDVREIVLEVPVKSIPLYEGSHRMEECLRFMTCAGFNLVKQESESDGQEANLTFMPAVGNVSAPAGPENAGTTQPQHEQVNQAARGRETL